MLITHLEFIKVQLRTIKLTIALKNRATVIHNILSETQNSMKVKLAIS